MNKVLSLKGKFEQKQSSARGGSPRLPQGATVVVQDVIGLLNDLQGLADFWRRPENERLGVCLISARYRKVAAKSNRIHGFLSKKSSDPNQKIVGAKFTDEHHPKHIITYCVSPDLIQHTLENMRRVIDIMNADFGGRINAGLFLDEHAFDHVPFKEYKIVKTTFQKCVVDAWYVTNFELPENHVDTSQSGIVTVFNTGEDTISLLKKFGIQAYSYDLIDSHTIRLDEKALTILMDSAPYLVAMSLEDISLYSNDDLSVITTSQVEHQIPSPGNQPIIGVIDTLFNTQVYMHEWVTFENCISEDIEPDKKDYIHGTQVSALIVDGPSLNPELDDGCGRFRVKHFGVALDRPTSSVDVIRRIRDVVNHHPEIHVWNLSLGSDAEINHNFISAEGSVLDQIQVEYNVIFVIAATNRRIDEVKDKRIGAPADSVNAMVVGSVDVNKKPAEYARYGGVLSFFVKPDVSYYGGTKENMLHTVDGRGERSVMGTSFSAPWISRKLAYLIEVIGLSREVAKALLIDAAISWSPETDKYRLRMIGNGVVPVRIEDILSADDSEIKFVMDGISEKYDTYNYKIPVPVVAQHQPFVAKATMCYYPSCSRNQGVDYTDTEMDLYFGRIDNNKRIKTINQNIQVAEEPGYVTEDDARSNYRKWDNVKHITEILKPNARAKKAYDNTQWGISIKTKERLQPVEPRQLKFGMVITLREINGVNRLEDFVQQASLSGWFVERIDTKERVDIYQQAETEVEFSDEDSN